MKILQFETELRALATELILRHEHWSLDTEHHATALATAWSTTIAHTHLCLGCGAEQVCLRTDDLAHPCPHCVDARAPSLPVDPPSHSSTWDRTVLPRNRPAAAPPEKGLALEGLLRALEYPEPREAPPAPLGTTHTTCPSSAATHPSFVPGRPLVEHDSGLAVPVPSCTLSHLLPTGDTVSLTVYGATVDAVLAQMARALGQLRQLDTEEER